MIKGGYLNSVSIGGIVKEWSQDYRTILVMEMVEFSVVPIPANASALITSRTLEEVTGKSIDTIKHEFQDFSREILLDKVKSMSDDELNDAIKVLKNLIARLEETSSTTSLTDAKDAKTVKRFILKEAQAVATQSQQVIRTIKLSIKE
jgi:ribosomal protein L29